MPRIIPGVCSIEQNLPAQERLDPALLLQRHLL
jgi:hypothetical protein